MPIYEYECTKCGQVFEKQLKLAQRLAQQACPQCGAEAATPRISAPAVVSARGEPAGPAMPTCPSSGGPCGCGF